MREQGSLKGEGTHRGNLCVDAQIFHSVRRCPNFPKSGQSGWRRSSLSGLLTVKGTSMREKGSLKGEGSHRRILFVDAQKFPHSYLQYNIED